MRSGQHTTGGYGNAYYQIMVAEVVRQLKEIEEKNNQATEARLN
jgi:hypothetical protein